MIIVTTNVVYGWDIKETYGLVKGSVVRSKSFASDMIADIRNIFGGELDEYTDMLEEARQIAINRMINEAEMLGADAIIGFRLSTSSIVEGASEFVAYGTAVKLDWLYY